MRLFLRFVVKSNFGMGKTNQRNQSKKSQFLSLLFTKLEYGVPFWFDFLNFLQRFGVRYITNMVLANRFKRKEEIRFSIFIII